MGETDTGASGGPTTRWALHDVRHAAAQALGLPNWDISDDADLLQHGLDSLRMMRLAGALRASGYDIPLADLAARPTVTAWFDIIEEIHSATANAEHKGGSHDLD